MAAICSQSNHRCVWKLARTKIRSDGFNKRKNNATFRWRCIRRVALSSRKGESFNWLTQIHLFCFYWLAFLILISTPWDAPEIEASEPEMQKHEDALSTGLNLVQWPSLHCFFTNLIDSTWIRFDHRCSCQGLQRRRMTISRAAWHKGNGQSNRVEPTS